MKRGMNTDGDQFSPDGEDAWGQFGTSEEEIKQFAERTKSLIKVFGVGGGGSNTVTRLFSKHIQGIDLIALNTDARHLRKTKAHNKILLGENLTRGLGSGGDPRVGEASAMESEQEIVNYARGTEIAFVTTTLGGGTGTGASPVVCRMLKEHGALTIAIATMPFEMEGKNKRKVALIGLRKLKEAADSVIIIPNDKLEEVAKDLPLEKGFQIVDEIAAKAVMAVTEIVTKTGFMNLDFNDLREVITNSKEAMIGIGISDAAHGTRHLEALKQAIDSPFLDVDLSTSTGVIVNVTGGDDMDVQEAPSVVEEVKKLVAKGARIKLGTRLDDALRGNVQVMLVVGGVNSRIAKGRDDSSGDEIDYIS
jgi:cell division protein FtsZ